MEKNVTYEFKGERAFTNGAHIIPIQITKKTGEVILMWIVDTFEEDTFLDGVIIQATESAGKLNDLLHGAGK